MSLLFQFLFPPPPSLFVNTMSFGFIALAAVGLAEVKGRNSRYSKFTNSFQNNITGMTISSRLGMLILYTPALVVSLASLSMCDFSEERLFWLCSALSLHYLKRVLEVIFVHKYSGQIGFESVIWISLGYFGNTATLIYAQYLTKGTMEPAHDLKYVGIVLFLIGIIGNFYHHFLLSKLRKEGEKGYKIPKGGLFGLVTCPHYLYEIVEFTGITCISQTLFGSSFTLGAIFYLVGRSYATRKWYLSKFENFPPSTKALIPFIF